MLFSVAKTYCCNWQLIINLQDYTAKLSDFGLAKAGPQGDETHVSTRVMGTYGYAAPEYVMTGMAYIVYASFSYVNYGSLVMSRITFSPYCWSFAN